MDELTALEALQKLPRGIIKTLLKVGHHLCNLERGEIRIAVKDGRVREISRMDREWL